MSGSRSGREPPSEHGGGERRSSASYSVPMTMAPLDTTASQQPGSSSSYGMAPPLPSSSFEQPMNMTPSAPYGDVVANHFNPSDAAGLSAIHAPIDFGNMMSQTSVHDFPPPLQQHQHYATSAAAPPIASHASGSLSLASKRDMEGGKQKKTTSKGKERTKAKKDDAAKNDGQTGAMGAGGAAKATKPRKRKDAGVDRENGAGDEQYEGDAAVDGGAGQNMQANRSESRVAEGAAAAAAKQANRGSGSKKAGSSGSRRPSKAQIKQQQSHEGSTPGPQHDSSELSRGGSTAPGTPAATAPGTGESTPTKRGGRGGGARSSRGGGSAGRRRGTAGRASSRGSRATSARMTASVAPGAVDGGGTAAPEDGAVAGEQNDDAEEEDGDQGSSSDDEGVDAGLEEDELDRQEAIQRQRSINMGPLMRAMSDEQQERYSAFRRHYLDKRFVRRLVYHLTRQTVTPQVATLVAGVGKVFIGEIVERARVVREEQSFGLSIDGSVALEPEHLIEALRRYRDDREVPGQLPPGAPNPSAGVGGNGKRRRMF